MTANTATDEDFQNYLYMLSTRGTAFWELYYSDSIMTDGNTRSQENSLSGQKQTTTCSKTPR